MFDISANLACPCGRYALLQDRHTSPKWTIMCSPTHSVQQEKKIPFSNRLQQNDGSTLGARGCRETQSAQSRGRKHAIKVHFIEITLLKVQSQTFDLCALFLVAPRFLCLFVICVKFHIFLEAQCSCINYSFNWAIHKYTKLKIS